MSFSYGSCTGKHESRLELHIAGASDSVIIVRGEEGHKKYSKLVGPIYLQLQNALDYPDAWAEGAVDGRKEERNYLQQLCVSGALRSKRDEFLEFLEWKEEEEVTLMKSNEGVTIKIS